MFSLCAILFRVRLGVSLADAKVNESERKRKRERELCNANKPLESTLLLPLSCDSYSARSDL